MKNTIISIIIFLSLLGFVTYANSSLNKLCTTIKKDTKEIYFLIEKDNWNESYSKSNDLIKNINDKNLILSIYLNHNDFDEILDEAIELSLYIHGKEKTDTLIALSTLKNSSNNIQRLHKPTFENIF